MLRPCLALLVCGLAPRLAAAAGSSSTEEERTNPYKGSADKTDECYAWAADGQCKVNADYMNSNCPYSCWEWFEHRRKKYPDAPIDKSMDCFNWAKDGEYAILGPVDAVRALVVADARGDGREGEGKGKELHFLKRNSANRTAAQAHRLVRPRRRRVLVGLWRCARAQSANVALGGRAFDGQ